MLRIILYVKEDVKEPLNLSGGAPFLTRACVYKQRKDVPSL